MHSQGNLLSGAKDVGGNRNARQRRFLDWLRGVHTAKEAELRQPSRRPGAQPTYAREWLDGDWGSPYSTFWPRGALATSVSVNLEHIIPSEHLRLSEAVLKEAALPRQDVTITTLANLTENSARNDRPLAGLPAIVAGGRMARDDFACSATGSFAPAVLEAKAAYLHDTKNLGWLVPPVLLATGHVGLTASFI